MKALTLTQPWASLVACGAKQIETRSWSTKYRGPLAIHAAKGFPKWAREFSVDPVCYNAFKNSGWSERYVYLARNFPAFPLGMVLAICILKDCLPTKKCNLSATEQDFGDYTPGRFGFLLENIEPIEPVLAIGALGLWEWKR